MSIDISTSDIGVVILLFLLGIAVFGFLPRMVIRLMARAFPKGDPRRDEMLAELHAVPTADRPRWVGEQLERVVMEAIPTRIKAARERRETWTLDIDGRTFRLTASRPLNFKEQLLAWRYAKTRMEFDDSGIGTATDQLVTRVLREAGYLVRGGKPARLGFTISRIAVRQQPRRDTVEVQLESDVTFPIQSGLRRFTPFSTSAAALRDEENHDR